MALVVTKLLLILKIYLIIFTISLIGLCFWAWKNWNKDPDLKSYLILDRKIINYQIYYPQDFLDDLPYFIIYLIKIIRKPQKLILLIITSVIVLVIRFIQFWVTVNLMPLIFLFSIIQIKRKKDVEFKFKKNINFKLMDICSLIFIKIPIAVSWYRSYNLIKFCKTRRRAKPNELKTGLFYFILRRFLGISLSTLSLIYRIHREFSNVDKNIWKKKKIYIPIIVYTRIINNIGWELSTYDHEYIQKSNKLRIYFDEYDPNYINFNPMRSFFVLAHENAGHFKGPILRNVMTPNSDKTKNIPHVSIQTDEDGDIIARDVFLTKKPLKNAVYEHDGKKGYMVYNQIQNIDDIQIKNLTTLNFTEYEKKKIVLNTLEKRLLDSNMGAYNSRTYEYLGDKFYSEAVMAHAKKSGDQKIIEIIRHENEISSSIYESQSSLENIEEMFSTLRTNPNLVNELISKELKTTNLVSGVLRVNEEHYMRQEDLEYKITMNDDEKENSKFSTHI